MLKPALFPFFVFCFLFLLPLQGLSQEPAEEYSTDEKLASMLMFGFRGSQIEEGKPILKDIAERLPFNYILFDKDVTENNDRNILSPDQLARLIKDLRAKSPKPFFIAVDQEGGQVRRLKPQKGFGDLPSAQKMGQENVTSTFNQAQILGKELSDLGINTDLAPVADVDTNPYNPLIGRLGRAFSSDPTLVAAHALAFGQGLAKNHIIPVLKHFPGQGCAEKDNHIDPVNISQCWNADIDLLPYAEIFKAGWPGMVMTGHLSLSSLDPVLPASLSDNIVNGLLRHGMNWQGVVITDDLQMKGVSGNRPLKETIELAINAGNDILLFGNNLEWDENLPSTVWRLLQELIKEGKLSEERINVSWQRIESIKKAYGMK